MASSPSIQDIVGRWQAGDQAAAEELFQRFSQRLWELAAAQLGRQLERRVDADDILQSVFRTFFRRSSEGQYSFDHSGALWQMLVRITLNKIRKQAARHRAGKRDFRLEVPGWRLPAARSDRPLAQPGRGDGAVGRDGPCRDGSPRAGAGNPAIGHRRPHAAGNRQPPGMDAMAGAAAAGPDRPAAAQEIGGGLSGPKEFLHRCPLFPACSSGGR